MAAGKSTPKQPPKRHPRPPLPSRLKPAQYARLFVLVGGTPKRMKSFLLQCRKRLKPWGYGEFTPDDLLDEAVLRLYLGDLPKGMAFPKKRRELIEAVERLGKRHFDNAKKRHQRHGPRPISLENYHEMEMIGQAATVQTTSVQTLQINLLRRMEQRLLHCIGQLESSHPSGPAEEEKLVASEIELF